MNNPLAKTVFITGATSGIGKATATLYAKRGYNVIITGRRKEKLEALRHKFHRKYAVNVKALCFDIRDKNATKKAWSSLEGNLKHIDILINNACYVK